MYEMEIIIIAFIQPENLIFSCLLSISILFRFCENALIADVKCKNQFFRSLEEKMRRSKGLFAATRKNEGFV